MRTYLRRTSFTARLIAVSVALLAALVIVDYVALLEVPRRIARDTVEIALREHVQSLNATFRDEREKLREETRTFVTEPRIRQLIISNDVAGIERAVADRLEGDIAFQTRDPNSVERFRGTGPIVYSYSIRGKREIAFYRQVETEVLDAAAAASDFDAHFALEHDGAFIATSTGFPESIDPTQAGETLEPDRALLQDVSIEGDRLHMYSRTLSADQSFQLHVLSSPELEQDALAEITADVRSAIGGMTLATIIAFLLHIYITNRTVHGFARRVAALAAGDYSTRMTVRGDDGFAQLSQSVNQLTEQLDEQLGRLEETAQAFSRTLETLEEGISVWSDEGVLDFWNRGAEQLTGLARERATLNDPVIAFLHAERTPGSRRVTLPVRRPGGGLVVDLVVTAMPGGGVLQTFRDTTTADLLQQTQRNFMATAAHELRTPITTILGFADTLTNPELELTDRQREEFIGIIREQAGQLQQISDAFFTNHQLANELVEVSIAPTRVDHVIDDAIARLRRSLPDHAERIDEIQVTRSMSALVLADRRALVGVLGVLLENALKYGEPPITIDCERSGGTITLLVRDEGPGIESHHHARLFDPFYRVDVDMRSGVGGAGLGLFTARKLIEAMHGSIRVLSSLGAPTTFVVDLPLAPVDTDDPTRHDDDSDGSGRLRLVG